MKKSVLNTALSTAFIVALGFGVSACSSEKEGEESDHILAVDRVDEAAEIARANAPAAEKMDFPATAPMPAADATTDATMSTEEGAVAVEGTAADATVSADSSDTAVATADTANSTEVPTTDSAEPATN
ncbi:hypothetical protein SC65A3_02320 [Psychrobacter sp. SC65A.3]|uniref:hypothetical protein n=1 Tax=Psychrobacter sp. SC65A.3 TaxID=2983299 RepID=UPI0021D82C55|nr:hypothetical protein [Psychrobacter sp. SC65A.3]WAI88835.1 hypothetical protein SC65A3_02320 [Psychrobacter sp. SC65A.3]